MDEEAGKKLEEALDMKLPGGAVKKSTTETGADVIARVAGTAHEE